MSHVRVEITWAEARHLSDAAIRHGFNNLGDYLRWLGIRDANRHSLRSAGIGNWEVPILPERRS